jgi:TRAP-type C4-dicarboxylate transport system permease small subunit
MEVEMSTKSKIYNKFKSFIDVMDEGFSYIGIIFLVLLIIASSLQVFTRYILNSSLMGTDEFAIYCFMWATMLGIPVCTRHNSHAAVGIVNESLKGRWKIAHQLVIYILMAITVYIMMIQGIRMTSVVAKQMSPVLRIPMKYIYLSIPVGFFGTLINVVVHIIDTIISFAVWKKEETK